MKAGTSDSAVVGARGSYGWPPAPPSDYGAPGLASKPRARLRCTRCRSATSYRLLVSAPGDVPSGDIESVMSTVARWNVIYGRQLGAVVVPVHWELHSAAEHGVRPQASLNTQLVKDADIVIAIFWHRLGSHTGEAESGTVEEINEAHENGAYVAILRCARDVDPRKVDPDQAERLSGFLDQIQSESLMLSYE